MLHPSAKAQCSMCSRSAAGWQNAAAFLGAHSTAAEEGVKHIVLKMLRLTFAT